MGPESKPEDQVAGEDSPPCSSPRPRFRIEKVTPAYAPRAGPFVQPEAGCASTSEGTSAMRHLLITRAAARTIQDHIAWGMEERSGVVEQGGILVGYAIQDDAQAQLQGVVVQAIPAQSSQASSVYLELDHDAWWRMYGELDVLRETGAADDLAIVGWYHTHPGTLDVFMSSTDRNTQRTVFGAPWQFAVVLNPQRQVWRAFCGPEAIECLGLMESV